MLEAPRRRGWTIDSVFLDAHGAGSIPAFSSWAWVCSRCQNSSAWHAPTAELSHRWRESGNRRGRDDDQESKSDEGERLYPLLWSRERRGSNPGWTAARDFAGEVPHGRCGCEVASCLAGVANWLGVRCSSSFERSKRSLTQSARGLDVYASLADGPRRAPKRC